MACGGVASPKCRCESRGGAGGEEQRPSVADEGSAPTITGRESERRWRRRRRRRLWSSGRRRWEARGRVELVHITVCRSPAPPPTTTTTTTNTKTTITTTTRGGGGGAPGYKVTCCCWLTEISHETPAASV
ncbi:hypothetical protein E2C01_056435 [Portunus trituberculatus]|uniref:Uncharacterized protein n=1 Tax=Portunus trituberculatus TaxID=210409 RepID=A0A5B7GQB7_PORTR|nr:hypothetical protein [Portunus trituberculatus]